MLPGGSSKIYVGHCLGARLKKDSEIIVCIAKLSIVAWKVGDTMEFNQSETAR
jgi:hypothetical protein